MGINNIDASTLHSLLQKASINQAKQDDEHESSLNYLKMGNSITIVDVREHYEYNEEHIKGAINIPLSNIPMLIDAIFNIHSNKIVIQCKMGTRSMHACQLLIEQGFSRDLWNLRGGINAWKETGYDIQTKAKM